jgi:GAF domain-containing protein
MLNTIKKFLASPIFEDDREKTRIAGLLNKILLTVIILTSAVLPFIVLATESANILPFLILVVPFIVVNIAAFIIMRRGNVRLASYIFLFIIGLGILGSYVVSDSNSIGATLSITILIAFTALLLDWRAVLALLVLTAGITLFSTIAQDRGWITPLFILDQNPISKWLTVSFIFLLTSLGVALTSDSLRRALDTSLTSQKSLEASNRELEQLKRDLEQRVEERTAALEKRATQLQTISNVARSIATIQDISTLLSEITKLISAQFGFYHAGIFLIDENKEYAVLRAANSEGGHVMLNRQHKLKLDSNSIVGYVTSREEPRIALDVGTDAVYFNNPDLPMTRSEMALPLRLGGHVIGALDVQSTQANAFSEEDIATLSILADQVAIAIENARLFSESQDALVESQDTFDKYVKQEWSSFTRQVRQTGFVYDGKRVTAMDVNRQSDQKRNIVQTGRLSLEKVSPTIAIPIKLRGQTIGMLDVRSKGGKREWTQDEITLLEAAAERAALALENARLVESAQRRAARERAIGEISSKIGTFSDMNVILQTAVEELGRRIGGATEVTIELGDDDTKTNS